METDISTRELRDACGQFATGVTVITGRLDNGTPVGVTVNSFTSVSLEPPLILFCLDKRALSFDAFSLNSSFVVNILASDQEWLSNQFAQQGGDKFTGVDYTTNAFGVPVLSDCLTTIECRMHAVHEGGDHQIIVGDVIRIDNLGEGAPLLYFRGGYERLA